MLNLTGQIQNFKEKISDNKLFQYVPLYRTNRQEEITIAQLAGQNQFILEALKTTHSIFLNYCWLNDRVYGKIIEHELNLHEQNVKFHSSNCNFQRKMEDSLRMYKGLYEESSSQNKKHKQIIESGLKTLGQQIQRKIDAEQLAQSVKKMIHEYDQAYTNEEISVIDQSMITGIFNLSQKLQKKNINPNQNLTKTGKVHFKDFYELKDEIHNIFEKIERESRELTFDHNISKQKITRHYQMIQQNSDDFKNIKNNLHKLTNEYNYNTKFVHEELEKLDAKIEDKCSDSEWRKKLHGFEMRTIEPLRSIIFEHINKIKEDVKKIKEDTYIQTNLAHSSVSQLTNEMNEHRSKMRTALEEAQILKGRFSDMSESIEQDLRHSNLRLDTFFNDYKKFGYEFQKNLKRQIAQLRNMIVKLSYNVEEKALKSIYKKIETDFGKIQHDLMQNRDQISNLSHLNSLANQEIQNLKETMVKKVNFGDLMKIMDAKVDKQEVTQLRKTINNHQSTLAVSTTANITTNATTNTNLTINSNVKNNNKNLKRSSITKNQEQSQNFSPELIKTEFFKKLDFSEKIVKTQMVSMQQENTQNKIEQARRNQDRSLKKIQKYIKTQQSEKKTQLKSLSAQKEQTPQRQKKTLDSFRRQRQRSSQRSIKGFQSFRVNQVEQSKYQTAQQQLLNKTNSPFDTIDKKNKNSRKLMFRNPKKEMIKSSRSIRNN